MRNNFKKIAAIVLVLVMSVSALVPAFAATACAHADYDVVSTTAATCAAEGVEKRTCKACAETFVVVLPKLEHAYTESVIAATCTANGTITNVCDLCGDVKTETIEAEGHKLTYVWAEDSKAEDACVKGAKYTKATCSACDYEDTTGGVIENGHEWELVAITKAPTCKTVGLATYKCADCGKEVKNQTVAKLAGHSATVIATVKAATCTTDATVRYNCAVCGTVEAVEEGTKGHGQNGFKAATASELTCTTNKVLATDKICKDCNALCKADGTAYSADELKANAAKCTKFFVAAGSDADGWFVTTAATCTAAGESYRTCLDCAKVETKTVKALGHNKGTYVDNAATCTDKGEAYFECTRCDEKLEYVETAALGHDMKTDKVWVNDELAGDPDEDVLCGESYQILNWCDRDDCDYALNPKVKKFADHVYVEVKVAATCSTYAYSYKACVCGAIEVTDDTDADGKYDKGTTPNADNHVYTNKDGEYGNIKSTIDAVTCTTAGHYTVACMLCDAAEKAVTVDALGHKYDELPKDFTPDKCVEGKVPGTNITLKAGTGTCLVATVYTAKCTTCNSAQITINPEDGTGVGHKKDLKNNYTEAKDPTCTENGTTEGYYCANPWCLVEVVKPSTIANNHVKDNLAKTEAVAATCVKDGSIEYYTCKLGTACELYNIDNAFAYTTDKNGNQIAKPADLVVKATGHEVIVWGVVNAATCSTVGYQTGVCEACDVYIEVAEYAASTGHEFDESKAVVDYVCEVGVFETNVCVACDTVVTTKIAEKAPHVNAEGQTLTTSCSNDVYGGRKCVKCNTIIEQDAHEYGAWVVEGVVAKQTCAACGDYIAVEHKAHTWDDGVKADGAIVYTCFCGATKTEAVENEAPAVEEPAKKGCGSSIAAVAVALVATLGTCVVFAGKKED